MTGVVAALASTVPATAAAPTHSFVVRGEVSSPAVTRGGLYYTTEARRQVVVERLDLATGQRTPAYSRPARRYTVETVRAGGGRVGIELVSEGRHRIRSWVIALDPAGGPPRTVARGLLRHPGLCGTQVSLEDVSHEGSLLVDRETLGCGARKPDVHRLTTYGTGPPATVATHRETNADEDPIWRLAGTWLLERTESTVRVRDLSTGASRRIRATRRRWLIGFADADARGDIVAAQVRFTRRTFGEELRLLAPGAPFSAGRVLFDDRQVATEPRFCGTRLVAHRVSAPREELVVYDDLASPGRSVFSSARPGARGLDIAMDCDADSAVIVDDRSRRDTLIEVVPLAP